MVFKKIVKFLCCFILWIRDFIKKFCKSTVFIFQKKNWDIWNPKFQQKSIVYYFFFIYLAFLAFCFLFHLSKLLQKLWSFLKYFIGRVRDFANVFCEILKVLLKKIMICKIFLFSKFCVLLFAFLFFFVIFDILFSSSSISTCQKIQEIFMFFLFFGLEILSKNFGKSWNIFQKKIDIWNTILLAFW